MKKNDIQWAISSPCEKKKDLSQFSLSKALLQYLGGGVGEEGQAGQI